MQHDTRSYLSRNMLAALVIITSALAVVGCGGSPLAAQPVSAEEVPVVPEDAYGRVIAEAVVEPVTWRELSFQAPGTIADLVVTDGDVVAQGDLLAMLSPDDTQLAVARAEIRVREARLALARLMESAEEVDVRQAENAVDTAAAALETARMNLSQLRESVLLNETLEDALEVFEDKRHVYDVTLARYEAGVQQDYWFVDDARRQMEEAKRSLSRIQQQGQLQWQEASSTASRAELAYQEAQDRLTRLLEGPDARDVAAAKLTIEAAEVSLKEATSLLGKLVLRAPFAGTVTRVHARVGQVAAFGQPVLVLAELDRLQARMVDVTELDVARVAPGQSVVVELDALPGVELAARVTRIDLQSAEYRGDVVFPVCIELDETTEGLRWGMTAVASIRTRQVE